MRLLRLKLVSWLSKLQLLDQVMAFFQIILASHPTQVTGWPILVLIQYLNIVDYGSWDRAFNSFGFLFLTIVAAVFLLFLLRLRHLRYWVLEDYWLYFLRLGFRFFSFKIFSRNWTYLKHFQAQVYCLKINTDQYLGCMFKAKQLP